jgi:FKBP-type peptidyl-prolyl cis-trans isomerase FklB
MKLFSILILSLGFLVGCGDKENKSATGNNSEAGEKFLAENAKKDGVKTTASGLQYKVIKSGTGESPKLTDTVKVHYHGTLIDGTVFDSSVERGEPISFPVQGVIPGWVEALQLMKVGDKWQLFIPAKLAYGAQSPSPKIGANSTLIFEVELLGIEK